jgi:hypothetical protein
MRSATKSWTPPNLGLGNGDLDSRDETCFNPLENVGLGRLESRGFLGSSNVDSGLSLGESSPCLGDSGAILFGVIKGSACHESNRGKGGSARLRSTCRFDSDPGALRCAIDSSPPGSKLFLPVLLLEFLWCRELRCESCIGVSFAGDESDLALTKDSCDFDFRFAILRGTSRLCLPAAVPGLKKSLTLLLIDGLRERV